MLFNMRKHAKSGCLSIGFIVCLSFGYEGRNVSI